MEMFRVTKNVLKQATFPESGWSLEEVLPEEPANDQKADLVFVGKQHGSLRVLLLVECKQRPLTAPGPSYSRATQQARRYASKVDSRYFAVYDGWLLFVFRPFDPFLVGCYQAALHDQLTESFASNLLVGLMEHTYRNQSDRLNRLPRPQDKELLKNRVFPYVARGFARAEVEEAKAKSLTPVDLEKRATQLTEEWMKKL